MIIGITKNTVVLILYIENWIKLIKMTRDELFKRSWNDTTYGHQVVLLKDAYDYADAVVQEKQDAINSIVENYPHGAVLESFLAGSKSR